jgi:lysophospholipase L1-like esterase
LIDDVFGLTDYDFMHFNAHGHARLAAKIQGELEAAGR